MRPVLGAFDERISLAENSSQESLYWGCITSVNTQNMTMCVEIASPGRKDMAKDIPINNMFTGYGMGMRMLPLVNLTYALLLKVDAVVWLHVGYYNEGLKNFLSNKTASNEEAVPLAILGRYLQEGEVQLVALSQNEIYLANDGSVLLKAQFGASLKLDNYKSRLEGNFANLKFEMDEVRIRAGNVIRPMGANASTEIYNYDDVQFVIDDLGNIISEEDIPDGEEANYSQIKEFLIQVGTQLDETTGIDDPTFSPYVGMIGMGEKIIDEYGEEIASGGKSLNFLVKTAGGGGIAIAEDGSFYIMDKSGGTITKFTAGDDGEKSLRIDKTLVSVSKTGGVKIETNIGSSVNLTPNGDITVYHGNKNNITLNASGITLSAPATDSIIALEATNINLIGNVTIGAAAGPVDTLLGATALCTQLDLLLSTWLLAHVHPGPGAPATLPFPFPPTFFTALNQTGMISASGIYAS